MHDILRNSKKEAKADWEFFNNGHKEDRERSVLKALLKIFKVNYTDDDIKRGNDPPDFVFKRDKFEITTPPMQGREIHKEYEKKFSKVEQLKSEDEYDEYIEKSKVKYVPDIPMSPNELLQHVGLALTNKEKSKNKENINLVIYISEKNNPFIVEAIDASKLKNDKSGWLSISVILGIQAGVLFCEEKAPNYIKDVFVKCKNGTTLLQSDSPANLWE